MKHQPPQTMETSSGDFLTVDQLVARWKAQVTSATLATWRSRGSGPKFVKVGGRVLYRLADVTAYESKNTRN
jgi:hypothetical protein